jgi:hypothetical protein
VIWPPHVDGVHGILVQSVPLRPRDEVDNGEQDEQHGNTAPETLQDDVSICVDFKAQKHERAALGGRTRYPDGNDGTRILSFTSEHRRRIWLVSCRWAPPMGWTSQNGYFENICLQIVASIKQANAKSPELNQKARERVSRDCFGEHPQTTARGRHNRMLPRLARPYRNALPSSRWCRQMLGAFRGGFISENKHVCHSTRGMIECGNRGAHLKADDLERRNVEVSHEEVLVRDLRGLHRLRRNN